MYINANMKDGSSNDVSGGNRQRVFSSGSRSDGAGKPGEDRERSKTGSSSSDKNNENLGELGRDDNLQVGFDDDSSGSVFVQLDVS